jgi:hypothetical protein
MSGKPRIVCVCGSTRFVHAIAQARMQLTLQGNIVVGPEVMNCWGGKERVVPDDVKERLDELHLRKIDMADEVFVVNPGGYVGESTKREILYANDRGIPVSSLEDLSLPEE